MLETCFKNKGAQNLMASHIDLHYQVDHAQNKPINMHVHALLGLVFLCARIA